MCVYCTGQGVGKSAIGNEAARAGARREKADEEEGSPHQLHSECHATSPLACTREGRILRPQRWRIWPWDASADLLIILRGRIVLRHTTISSSVPVNQQARCGRRLEHANG